MQWRVIPTNEGIKDPVSALSVTVNIIKGFHFQQKYRQEILAKIYSIIIVLCDFKVISIL